jgi:hypothetical protein
LHQPLFDRLPRGAMRTEAGQRMLEHARRVLAEMDDARPPVKRGGLKGHGYPGRRGDPDYRPFPAAGGGPDLRADDRPCNPSRRTRKLSRRAARWRADSGDDPLQNFVDHTPQDASLAASPLAEG